MEIVAVGGSLFLFARRHFGRQHALAGQQRAHPGAGFGVLGEAFGQNVPGSGQSGLGVGNIVIGVHITGGLDRGVAGAEVQQPQGQGLQPSFAGLGGAGAALGTERQIHVLQPGQIGRGGQGGVQIGGEQAAFFQRSPHGGAAFVQFGQGGQAVAHGGHGHFIQAARGFFAIAGYKGHGGVFAQQAGRGLHLGGAKLEFGGQGANMLGGNGYGHGGLERLKGERIRGGPHRRTLSSKTTGGKGRLAVAHGSDAGPRALDNGFESFSLRVISVLKGRVRNLFWSKGGVRWRL